MSEHKRLWENWSDYYYLKLIDKCLNHVPEPPNNLNEMTEAEVDAWLRSLKIEGKTGDTAGHEKFKIHLPSVEKFCESTQSANKTDIVNLPLSLEDNSTLKGTASILEEFAAEFDIPCGKPNEYIEFDCRKKEFDLKSARERYAFMKLVQIHHIEMVTFEKQLQSGEKSIEIDVSHDFDVESDDSDECNEGTKSTSEKDGDNEFDALFKRLVKQAQDTVVSTDEHILDKTVLELSRNKKINNCRDRYDRTVFHAAVEEKQYTLVNILLACGINPNAKEGCGATPMSLAVINSDLEMCKILTMNFAEYNGELFRCFPSPLEMAVAMNLDEIVSLFNSSSKKFESPLVTFIQGASTTLPVPDSCIEDNFISESNNISEVFVFKRSECKEFPTAVVGDVGTCKNNRSVKNPDSNAYGWCAEIPGDMHAKGYLCEAAFKALGDGGFHKVVNVVMKRHKVTKEAFKKRKFQDQNLNRIKESVRDGSQSYGMAAIKEFHSSPKFPQ